MPNEFLSDIVSELHTPEVRFAVDEGPPRRVTIRSITLNLTKVIQFLYLFSVVALLSFGAGHWQFQNIPLAWQRTMLFFGLLFIVITLRYMPQRIVMTPDLAGVDKCLYSWGIYSFALRFFVPVSQIKGIFFMMTVYGKNRGRHISVPCLGIQWSAPYKPFLFTQPFLFARYSDNETAWAAAREISAITGLPIIDVSVQKVTRRKQ